MIDVNLTKKYRLGIEMSPIYENTSGIEFQAFITPYKVSIQNDNVLIDCYVRISNSNYELCDDDNYYGEAEIEDSFDITMTIGLYEFEKCINASTYIHSLNTISIDINEFKLNRFKIVKKESNCNLTDTQLRELHTHDLQVCDGTDMIYWLEDSKLSIELVNESISLS